MIYDDKIMEVINFLPHGTKKAIAEKAGVSPVTVKRFFERKSISYDKGKAIFIATMNIYREFKEEAVLLKAIMAEDKSQE